MELQGNIRSKIRERGRGRGWRLGHMRIQADMTENLGMDKTTREKKAQIRIPNSINPYKSATKGGAS